MDNKIEKVIILGSGPAGYTAAVYAARAALEPLLITGLEVGGQMTTTTDVDNWPGDDKGVQGPELMIRMKNHAERFGTKIVYDSITSVDLQNKNLKLFGENSSYTAATLIVATGASAKYLGLESEKAYLGKGVSACATCDGFFFKGAVVAVVGGGNTAVEEALYLSNIAAKVILIHRRNTLRAEKILIKKLFEKQSKGNVDILWDHELVEVIGDGQIVKSIEVLDKNENEIKKIMLDGVFVAIGHEPNTKLFTDQLEMADGYIIVNKGAGHFQTQTSRENVFAAGDVADSVYRQAITSAGTGCMAALDVERYFESKA
ncbi:MAG: thioredoxin-disulfide reductase [Pseudomonadota bacterium]|nr:thioredoxin-disulfide reductase [Pseudomonadota bacterium]